MGLLKMGFDVTDLGVASSTDIFLVKQEGLILIHSFKSPLSRSSFSF